VRQLPLLPLLSSALLLLAPACSDYKLGGLGPDVELAGPDIRVDPPAFDFGTLDLGCERDQVLTVSNVGDTRLTVDSVGWSTGGAIYGESPSMSLGPGESDTLLALYVPVAEGEDRATVSIHSDDPDEEVVEVPLLGQGRVPSRTDTFTQPGSAIDVLWVVDNSSSMAEEQARVISDIESFFGWFDTLGLDYHVGVITTDIVTPTMIGRLQGDPVYITPDTPDPSGTLAVALNVGTVDMGDESGLAALQDALSEPLLSTDNVGFLREEAHLVAVLLSDEPEQSGVASSEYIGFLEELKTDASLVEVSAIVGDRETGCTAKCDGAPSSATPGDAYIDVAEAFDGVVASICTCDLQPDLDRVGLAATLFSRQYPLEATPTDSAGISVTVDGEERLEGWVYDPASNTVILDEPPATGALVAVTYPVPTTCD